LKPPKTPARVIGLTGAPGAGKSTVTGALVAGFPARGLTVADRHDAWLDESGERTRRRLARARDEVTALAFGRLARLLAVPDSLAARVADGALGPHEAAAELLAAAGLPDLADG
jgi:ABC-type glutathione transport system ATPase component